MKKGYKITILALAAVLFCGAIGYAINAKLVSNRNETTTTVPESSSNVNSSSVPVSSSEQQTTTEATTVSRDVGKLILGKWTDGAEMSGYEFFEGGRVTVTFVNVTVPILNLPVNGTYDGTYIVTGDTITTNFSIYTATIKDTYVFTVDESTLTMRNTEDSKVATYMRKTQTSSTLPVPSETTTQSAESGEIVGTWTNADGKIKYSFESNGTFTALYSATTSAGVPAGAYSGVYILENDSLTIQYTAGMAQVEKYTCSVAKNMITLLDTSGISRSFTRDGTAFSSGSTDVSDLKGKWMDGANMSGFEFSDAGLVTVTYVNVQVPVVNIPITGKYDGAYIVNGDKLSMNYSIYGNVIRKTYTFSVNGDTLTLTDSEDGKVSTYIRK